MEGACMDVDAQSLPFTGGDPKEDVDSWDAVIECGVYALF
jgi:hypothetical protein